MATSVIVINCLTRIMSLGKVVCAMKTDLTAISVTVTNLTVSLCNKKCNLPVTVLSASEVTSVNQELAVSQMS